MISIVAPVVWGDAARREERDDLGHVFRWRHLAQRQPCGGLGQVRVSREIGGDPAGSHGIGQHPIAGEPAGDALGQREQPSLGSPVRQVIGVIAPVGGSAGDIDDDAARPAGKMADGEPAQVRGCTQVEGQVVGPALRPVNWVLNRRGDPGAGVVDQNVDYAPPGQCFLPQGGGARLVEQVNADSGGALAQLSDQAIGELAVGPAVHDDERAVPVQRPRHSGANSSRPPGDQNRAARTGCDAHATAWAPVISTAAPQMNGASSDARNATSAATSAGWPMRPAGTSRSRSATVRPVRASPAASIGV